MQKKVVIYKKTTSNNDKVGRTNSKNEKKETAFLILKSLFSSQGKQIQPFKLRL